MNRIEKLIYDRVKSLPWLKYLLRNIYQSAFDILPKQKEFSIAPIEYREGYFFGFHDKTPFSENGDKLLANQLTIPLRMPMPNEKLNIGYFHINSGEFVEFIKIGESLAWNYHKGCRLQWLNNEKLIYNTANNGRLISKIISIESLNTKVINYPVDTVSADGEWATSFSYERLQELMPGYGYPYTDNGFLEENSPLHTGLFVINLSTNKRELLLSLKVLAFDFKDNPKVQNSRHYVTHTEFSPDGRYISFLHRWTNDDIRDRTSRLVIYDLKMKNYFALPTDGMVSHYQWNQQNQIVAYCKVDGLDSHVLFNVPDVNNYKVIANRILNSDGHQSFINNNNFVTDTYPDRFRMAKLFKVNIENSAVQLLASMHSPKKFQTRDFKKHIACDLHPRVSGDGNYICFDSVRTGKRSICLMPLK